MTDNNFNAQHPGDKGIADIVRKRRKKGSFGARIRNYFLAGLIFAAPVGATIYLVWSFISAVDESIAPLIPAQYQTIPLPGLGLVIAFLALTFIGFVATNYFGRVILNYGERLLEGMPVVRSVYSAIKQITETLMGGSKDSFSQVVLVEYPRRDSWTLGFLTAATTGEVQRRLDDDLITIYVPTTPNPTSGFMLIVPKDEIHVLDMTVEEGMKMVVSIGMITPPDREAEDYVPVEDTDLPEWRRRQEALLTSLKSQEEAQRVASEQFTGAAQHQRNLKASANDSTGADEPDRPVTLKEVK